VYDGPDFGIEIDLDSVESGNTHCSARSRSWQRGPVTAQADRGERVVGE
jgi:hypothetical protein